ncbi:MAG: relaxase domain-containing protein [Lewinellaceae bacterium]|nr:relaxase domain-containing protein [Lewinellaceae bacterium]
MNKMPPPGVRARGRNENRLTENLVWGTFTHEDARPVGGIPDPHLHQHVFVFNATYDKKEERFKAAQFGDIKANAPYFEAAFHSRLVPATYRKQATALSAMKETLK